MLFITKPLFLGTHNIRNYYYPDVQELIIAVADKN
jgi:hypothetical protein